MTNDTATSNHSNRPTDTGLGTGSVIHGNGLDRDFRRRSVRQMGHEPTSTIADASQRPRLNRSRWAAIGAAVAVSLGAGGFGLASATVSTGEQPVYIAISPCRLADTRPQFLVGNRATPINGPETVTYVGTGAQGNCNVPAGVSALVLNVTALDATLPTFLQFAPGNSVPPSPASSLNPVPGEPPTPNAVTIPIDDEGEFSMYNLQGTVNVIVDIVGYYDDHEHTGADIVDGTLEGVDVLDSSLTGADVTDGSIAGADVGDESITGTDIADHSVASLDTSNEAGVAFRTTTYDPALSLNGTEQVIASAPIRVPSNGFVTVTASINWLNLDADFDIAMCQITKGTTIDSDLPTFNLNDMDASATFAMVSETSSRTFSVAVADNPLLFTSGQPINLVCDEIVGNILIFGVHISAEFVPTSYNPGFFILPPIILPFTGDEETV